MTDNRKRRENSGTLIQLIIVNEQVTSSIEAAFQRNDISQQLNLTGGESRGIVQIDRLTGISMVNLRRFVVHVVLLIKLTFDDLSLPQVRFTDGIVGDQTYDEITPPMAPPSTPVQSDKFTRSLNDVIKLCRRNSSRQIYIERRLANETRVVGFKCDLV